ncbi:3',5'-cyclic-AMP phosphodiesterase [Salinispirillum marinum]|uniref:3',5'-cyclic-AMP phosphodiesterase n=2 Tax=Saccharospirillaceae TaxID=255527 RepID=A0ABV8BA29_9GAMM
MEQHHPWRIVQLTDSHLYKDPDSRLMGMNTAQSFAAVVDLVRLERPQIDAILGTGDITQDASIEAYDRFRQSALALCPNMVWIPGNHDEAALMQRLPFPTDHNQRLLDNDFWRIVLLDSSILKTVHGKLSKDELTFLDDALASAGDRFVMIAMHHNPIPSGSVWLDNHSLQNTDDFHAVIDRYPKVKVILWGHIHQQVDKNIQGRRYLATPSTCVQFAPHQVDFKADDAPPGYRWLDLYPDGHIETAVSRVNVKLDVDLKSGGY